MARVVLYSGMVLNAEITVKKTIITSVIISY